MEVHAITIQRQGTPALVLMNMKENIARPPKEVSSNSEKIPDTKRENTLYTIIKPICCILEQSVTERLRGNAGFRKELKSHDSVCLNITNYISMNLFKDPEKFEQQETISIIFAESQKN